ncbi:MinD/ParA family protein [Mycobacterium kansasii]|nr:MinD/ParA family protein [Mycobacterium kansasii]UCA21876.1 MinD/ParA family protein [Mycobacterium kansasii]UGT81920.1 MinD/ParA family protein [Mycobacterium kansasii]UGT86198.1 MinD/ParA family protein [Mycobacterium kansasii]UGU25563.1 MinD/ParA family protein [Mycobacterium kansasii]
MQPPAASRGSGPHPPAPRPSTSQPPHPPALADGPTAPPPPAPVQPTRLTGPAQPRPDIPQSATPPHQPMRPLAPPDPARKPPQSAPSDVPIPPRVRAERAVIPATGSRGGPADHGWRRLVRVVSFGLVNPGPSAAQREAADFEAAIRTALRGSHKVGVLGKGGVGKTSVAASIGSIFAELRQPDRVVAIDADTAFGRLSSRIDPAAHGSFWDLTAAKDLPSFADIVARLGRNSVGLHVLPGEPMAGARRVLDPAIYREAVLRLDRHFAISVIDCGSTMDAPLTQEVLRDLDALIVVSSPWADGASAAAKTMEWLSDRRLTDLLRRSVVVLNDSDGHSDKRTRSVLAREFVEHGQRVVEVPFDPHLRPGGVIDVRHELAPATRLKLLQIAAIIVEYFASGPAERRAPRPEAATPAH